MLKVEKMEMSFYMLQI